MEEVRVFLSVVLVAIIIITFDISNMYDSLFEAITASAFQVASIVSSTGFATTDFDL
jgi:trk system potassium uptake protein TrkH